MTTDEQVQRHAALTAKVDAALGREATAREDAAMTCGAQDWAYDDNDQPFIYGTCSDVRGHDGYWHVQYTPRGSVWASWRGPHDARAPEGARDGVLGGGPHD